MVRQAPHPASGWGRPIYALNYVTIKTNNMSNIGKKLLSAFVEVKPSAKEGAEDKKEDAPQAHVHMSVTDAPASVAPASAAPATDNRFAEYFDKLFSEANIPGPDYYEFSKMIGVMQAIPDELSRFSAAFAGLQVQGLSKEKLLSTASEYLQVLETDAAHFNSTVAGALQEKVQDKKAEVQEKATRIQALSKEIAELQSQIIALDAAIKENEEKIGLRQRDYTAESKERKARISADIEKIKQYIH